MRLPYKNIEMKRIIFPFVLLLFLPVYIHSQETNIRKNHHLIIETSLGDIEILLYDDTPLHRDNMIKLVEEGFYTNHLFHRVIQNFMIQGGDPHSVNAPKGQRLGTGGPGYRIPAEFRENRIHKKGAIAAARRGDAANPKKESSGSQFYIVQGQVFSKEQLAVLQSSGKRDPFTPEEIEIYTTIGGTPHLDGSYTVFGEVVNGLDVVDKIAALQTDPNNRPLEDVVFSIRLH